MFVRRDDLPKVGLLGTGDLVWRTEGAEAGRSRFVGCWVLLWLIPETELPPRFFWSELGNVILTPKAGDGRVKQLIWEFCAVSTAVANSATAATFL